jgi:hypothetical protein
MQKFHLDCAYAVCKFKHHDQVKNLLLEQIKNAEYQTLIDPGCDTHISKTDWHDASNFKRSWVDCFVSYLKDPILEIYNNLGYDGYTIHELWFQQYNINSGHGWHTHSSNFTNVYYLEMPSGAPKTKIVSPYNQTDIIEVQVEEGDILVFPSFVIHKAPPNTISQQKTIISYNINATYSNNIYGNGLIE